MPPEVRRRLRDSSTSETVGRRGTNSQAEDAHESGRRRLRANLNSVHLADLPKALRGRDSRGTRRPVKVLRVGIDGTDKEINAAEYGRPASPDFDFLVIGTRASAGRGRGDRT